MSIPVTCPKCVKKSSVPDAMNGLMVRCPNCQHQFLARSARPKAVPAARLMEAIIDEDYTSPAIAAARSSMSADG